MLLYPGRNTAYLLKATALLFSSSATAALSQRMRVALKNSSCNTELLACKIYKIMAALTYCKLPFLLRKSLRLRAWLGAFDVRILRLYNSHM